jgi:RNA polymerase sigma factor (sigma-70 family)
MVGAMERTNDTHGQLLIKARDGDQDAWSELVDRMSPMVWSIARGFQLDHATATDVAQTVWLKLVDNLDRIDDPERLPGWMATTCRREALRVADARKRVIPSEFEFDLPDPTYSVESAVVEEEEVAAVRNAFDSLDADDQLLLRLVVLEPSLSYQEISQITGRPIGSLGPTRARALNRLRRALDETTTKRSTTAG